MKQIERKNNKSSYIIWGVICYSLALFISQIKALIGNYNEYLQLIPSYEISDWPINYEGGFVRRGFIGQILYFLYDWTNLNIVHFLIVFNFIILCLFTLLFIRKWRQYKLSILLLPNIILLGSFWNAPYSYLSFRRDILLFLFIWVIFYTYKQAIDKKWFHYIPYHFLSCIAILSHEASIFYMLPIVCLHFFSCLLKKNTWRLSLCKLIVFLLPSTLVFLLSSYYKGNAEIANSIWNSWQPMFSSFSSQPIPLGKGAEALAWTIDHAISFHLKLNFFSFQKYTHLPNLVLWPFVFLSVFYLLVNVNKYQLGVVRNQKPFSVIKFTHILLVEYLFMLPMFIALSCDYLRLFSYCIITTFLFYFTIPDHTLSVLYHPNISFIIKRICLVFNKGIFAKKTFYNIVFLCIGIPWAGFSMVLLFNSSIIGTFIKSASQIILYLTS